MEYFYKIYKTDGEWEGEIWLLEYFPKRLDLLIYMNPWNSPGVCEC